MAAPKNIKKADKNYRRERFMTQDEMREIDNRITKILQNNGNMSALYAEWQKIEEAYQAEQPKLEGRPNTRVNIMNSNIEGQIAGIIDQNMAITTKGEGPSDKHYADFARIGLDWTFRKNYIKKIIDQHERRRLKFGTGVLKVHFDSDAIHGFGLTKITCVPLTKIFIDNKVKDPLKLQDGEYIAEPIRMSKSQGELLYGKEKMSTVDYGNFNIENSTVFQEKETMDDEDGWTLIQWWERHEGTLRLVEFSGCGVLLFDSHKGDDRKENQKNKKYDHTSYYQHVNDKYPYFLTVLYPIEGQLFGFGDGKLLQALNDMLNDLYDKIRIAARPHLLLFDPNSEVDLEDFDENSFEPRPANLASGKAVDAVPWGTVNESWWRLLQQIHTEVQKVTRFSDLMMGQGSTSNTATESTIQQQQGNAATDQKKQILEVTLQEMCEYILGIMMENYTEGKAFRLSEDKEDYAWIDFRDLTKVPAMKPATLDFMQQYKKAREGEGYIDNNIAEWEILTDNKGQPITKNVDLDIEISIGAGLPKNKAFMWQMIEKLSQMFSVDATGMKRTVVSYEELRSFINQFVGLPLEIGQVAQMMQQPVPGQPMPGEIPGQSPNTQYQSPDAPLTMNNNPMMGSGQGV